VELPDAYNWNREKDQTTAMDIFPALAHQTETLVFEMGYPDEGYEWCGRLPPMSPSPQAWILEMLSEYFEMVDILPPPAHSGLFGRVRHKMTKQQLPGTLLERLARRLLVLDPRDGRHVYVARHQ
jgi:hypothetical protein